MVYVVSMPAFLTDKKCLGNSIRGVRLLRLDSRLKAARLRPMLSRTRVLESRVIFQDADRREFQSRLKTGQGRYFARIFGDGSASFLATHAHAFAQRVRNILLAMGFSGTAVANWVTQAMRRPNHVHDKNRPLDDNQMSSVRSVYIEHGIYPPGYQSDRGGFDSDAWAKHLDLLNRYDEDLREETKETARKLGRRTKQ